jgi:NAD(P)-dependent dehydrogenase (short-subunit alcohol dehydrogenase family)
MKEPNESTVLITGASGGIGAACVQAFAEAGARVVLADVDESGREWADRLGAGRGRFIRTDVSDPASVENLIAQTIAAFGTLDVLVNNAAVLLPNAPVHETTLAEFDALIAVNLRGVFLCCKYAYPHLAQSRGCIINVSSMSGVQGEKGHAVYAATKGALNALTRSMAVDYGPVGIRCNAVCPSSVLTPNTDRIIAARPDADRIVQLRQSINVLGYTATPDQIAAVVVFLAAPAAGFITGALLPVSGGTECGYGVKY